MSGADENSVANIFLWVLCTSDGWGFIFGYSYPVVKGFNWMSHYEAIEVGNNALRLKRMRGLVFDICCESHQCKVSVETHK